MPMHADNVCFKIAVERLLVALTDIEGEVLYQRWCLVQHPPVSSNVPVYGLGYRILTSEEGAEGLVEIEVGKVFWMARAVVSLLISHVGISASGYAISPSSRTLLNFASISRSRFSGR